MEKVNLPDMEKGAWKVFHYKVEDVDFRIIKSGRLHPTVGNIYPILTRNGTTVMSDTEAELRDHMIAEWHARGHCLINGLGLGALLKAVLKNPEVTQVTVIEISQDLIDLISPFYQDPRVSFVCADAFKYEPPKGIHYGMVWHDIWDTICTDNLPEMTKLHRKYGKLCDWQGSWARDYCERQARAEAYMNW